MALAVRNILTWNRALLIGVGASVALAVIITRWRRNARSIYFGVVPAHIRVHLVSSVQECEKYLPHLNPDAAEIIGFDTEWKPHSGKKRNRVSMLQLAFADCILLVRLHMLGTIPPRLKNLLESKSILKAGVAVASDGKLLLEDYGIMCAGLIDLQALAHRYDCADQGTGLSTLSARLVGLPLNKAPYLRCSNWERRHLSFSQINYAASDAYVGRAIFLSFNAAQQSLVEWCVDLVDKRVLRIKPRKDPNAPASAVPSKTKSEPVMPARKSRLYENCHVLAPDGELMFTCDRKKIRWYLEKSLAEVVSEDPMTIKLKFEPAGKGKANDPYYLAEKENQCVACGRREELCKHSVVPHCYRAHFPAKIKSRSSHDIVLLCTGCNARCASLDAQLMQRLAHEWNAPLNGSAPKFVSDPQLTRVKSAANALKSAKNLPSERQKELLDILREHYHKEEITEEILAEALALDPKSLEGSYRSHGAMVVGAFQSEDDLRLFIVRWRKHFISTMQPKFMPSHWDVEKDIFVT